MTSAARGFQARLGDDVGGSRISGAAREWTLAARGFRARPVDGHRRLADFRRGSRMDGGGSRISGAVRGWTFAARGLRARLVDEHSRLADFGRGSWVDIGGCADFGSGSQISDAVRGWTLAARRFRTRFADGHWQLADFGRGSRMDTGGSRISSAACGWTPGGSRFGRGSWMDTGGSRISSAAPGSNYRLAGGDSRLAASDRGSALTTTARLGRRCGGTPAHGAVWSCRRGRAGRPLAQRAARVRLLTRAVPPRVPGPEPAGAPGPGRI